MEHTLLTDFVMERLSEHVKPERKGKRKGSPIGFSKIKYKATILLSLGNLNLRRYAEVSKISYGVLHRWTTEKEFKKYIQLYMKDYVEYFWNFVQELSRKNDENWKASFASLESSIPDAEDQAFDKKLADYATYNPQLQRLIIDRFNSEFTKMRGSVIDLVQLSFLQRVFSQLQFFLLDAMSVEKRKEWYRGKSGRLLDQQIIAQSNSLKAMASQLLDSVVERLEKPTISLKERKQLVRYLKVVKEGLKRIGKQ